MLSKRKLNTVSRDALGILTIFIKELKDILEEEGINNKKINKLIDIWINANNLKLDEVITLSADEVSKCKNIKELIKLVEEKKKKKL